MKYLLLGIDLESVTKRLDQKPGFKEDLLSSTSRYLELLKEYNAKATFFVVGDVAREQPDVVRLVMDAGHEIACHSNTHVTLENFTPDSFRKDLELNLESLYKLGVKKIVGYRAPVLSMNSKVLWAYEILSQLGFRYSSSVLPTFNLFYSWNHFGNTPKVIDGIMEIPITSTFISPIIGGVYFRMIPKILLAISFSWACRSNNPIVGYIHPYDADTKAPHIKFSEIDSPILNWLMYYNRSSVLSRLRFVLRKDVKPITYSDWLDLES